MLTVIECIVERATLTAWRIHQSTRNPVFVLDHVWLVIELNLGAHYSYSGYGWEGYVPFGEVLKPTGIMMQDNERNCYEHELLVFLKDGSYEK
jgi:hypothetical protein